MSLFARKNEETKAGWRNPVVNPSTVPAADVASSGPEIQDEGDHAADALLGKGSRVSGKLHFEGNVCIRGEVEGEIEAGGTVIVEEGATVTAKISADTVVVNGEVTANVIARKKLEIGASGRIHGNVVAGALKVHEGAVLEGGCSMSDLAHHAAQSLPARAARGLHGRNGAHAPEPDEAIALTA